MTTNTKPLTFDEFFKDYKNYDNGGKLDKLIVADAKKVYLKLKTPKEIERFSKLSCEKQNQMVPGLDEGHSGFSFCCVCSLAYRYASYIERLSKEKSKKKFAMSGVVVADKIADMKGSGYVKGDVTPEMGKKLRTLITRINAVANIAKQITKTVTSKVRK